MFCHVLCRHCGVCVNAKLVIEATVPLYKNGCKIGKKTNDKMINDVGLLMALNERTKTRKTLSSLCHKKKKQV